MDGPLGPAWAPAKVWWRSVLRWVGTKETRIVAESTGQIPMWDQLTDEDHGALAKVLGHLNFSSGSPDSAFLAGLNRLFERASSGRVPPVVGGSPAVANWTIVGAWLERGLEKLRGSSSVFANVDQASAVVRIVFGHVLPAYRQWHADLLAHQPDDILFNSFFVGRVCEAVLADGATGASVESLVERVVTRISDYLGHRPIATLESQKIEPYAHERTCPIPLYIAGAGCATGRYRLLVERSLAFLQQTTAEVRREAFFDIECLDELSLDARAYDFEHPVHRRPNYQFGQWDPHHIDNRGRYRRFVVQQITLDALLNRVVQAEVGTEEERLEEAAAVLAGTILMASGVSGSGPDAHDSNQTLGVLLPRIAAYRDVFYEQVMQRLPPPHAARLEQESRVLHQPLGGVRQHLNQTLLRWRVTQLERAQLARLYARMGYPEQAETLAQSLPVASSRMACQVECALVAAERSRKRGELEAAARHVDQAMELIHRAIECGAMVDPWNVLGFDGQISLFPALENSVHDHRVDEIIDRMNQVFEAYSAVWGEAAAVDHEEVCQHVSLKFEQAARWWHQFAIHEVEGVPGTSALDAFEAAGNVARALNLWHKGGAAAGDIAFWSPHVEMFNSPRSNALVVERLLDRGDVVSSLALLVQWVSRARQITLEYGGASLYQLAERWLAQQIYSCHPQALPPHPSAMFPGRGTAATTSSAIRTPQETWALVRKFFDYLEANAEEYWVVPEFSLKTASAGDLPKVEAAGAGEIDESEDEDRELFGAAYEDVVYRDSTDDGVQSGIFDRDDSTYDALESECERIVERLAFLHHLACLWRTAAMACPGIQSQHAADADNTGAGEVAPQPPSSLCEHLVPWYRQAERNRRELLQLLEVVQSYRLRSPSGTSEDMIDYDRQRAARDALMEQIIIAAVETTSAAQWILASLLVVRPDLAQTLTDEQPLTDEHRLGAQLLAQLHRANRRGVRQALVKYRAAIKEQTSLYVPLARGGRPLDIVASRQLQNTMRILAISLPRIGLLTETRQLLDMARKMERTRPAGPGAVTQFDELFEDGYRALVESIVSAARRELESLPAKSVKKQGATARKQRSDVSTRLVECVEHITERMLLIWLKHSRTLRLSVLERVSDTEEWESLVTFIKRYGRDIFTQTFLNMGNLRAILHQGVGTWLDYLVEHEDEVEPWLLLRELDENISRDTAIEYLTTILEAIVENYEEYRDYNSTTTQSDSGDNLYALLDFLRFRASYERVVWNLRPVVVAHEVLLRGGCPEAAALWRRALVERIGGEAENYVERLTELQQKYAMRMASIADRVGERFLRCLAIDRMRALIEPAMQQVEDTGSQPAFELLQEEADLLLRESTGGGFEIPAWLTALHQEVDRIQQQNLEDDDVRWLRLLFPANPLSLALALRQINNWDQ